MASAKINKPQCNDTQMKEYNWEHKITITDENHYKLLAFFDRNKNRTWMFNGNLKVNTETSFAVFAVSVWFNQ